MVVMDHLEAQVPWHHRHLEVVKLYCQMLRPYQVLQELLQERLQKHPLLHGENLQGVIAPLLRHHLQIEGVHPQHLAPVQEWRHLPVEGEFLHFL